MTIDGESLEDHLKDDYGPHLRTIAEYDRNEFNFMFLRKDVHETYSKAEIEKIFNELRMEDLHDDYHEGLYHLGEMQVTQRMFEKGLVCHVNRGGQTGVIVTLDPDAAPEASSLCCSLVGFFD